MKILAIPPVNINVMIVAHAEPIIPKRGMSK